MKKTNTKQTQKQTHPALQTLPVQIFAGKLAREANKPVSPAYELPARKILTEEIEGRP
jgi:hypothetical protein